MAVNQFLEGMQDKIGGAQLAQGIADIAEAMKVLNETRLNRKAIIGLIHLRSKVPMRTIELVLNNLEMLGEIWLKPE